MPIVTRRAKSTPSMRSRNPWTKCWRDCSPSVTMSMPAASCSSRATSTASRLASSRAGPESAQGAQSTSGFASHAGFGRLPAIVVQSIDAATLPCYSSSALLTPPPRGDFMLRELARKIDAFHERWGHGVSWLMFGMVLVVFGDVIFRYVFNRSWVFVQELEWHLFGIIYLLAAGYTMLHNEHVRVDIWYAKQSPRTQAWVDFVLLFVMFFPSCLLIVYTTWPFLRNSFMVNEGSPDPGGIPARWALKSVIIIGFVLLVLQGISQAIKNFYWAMGWEEPETQIQEIH